MEGKGEGRFLRSSPSLLSFFHLVFPVYALTRSPPSECCTLLSEHKEQARGRKINDIGMTDKMNGDLNVMSNSLKIGVLLARLLLF